MKTALLVIDAQKIYTEPAAPLYCKDSKRTLDRINDLITVFVAKGDPVIFVRHTHRPDGSDLGRMFDYRGSSSGDFLFKEHSDEVEYSDGLFLPTNRFEITKHRYSAFAGTPLHDLLTQEQIGGVAICGFMTNCCCESTARDAHDRDYFVDFIVDATGTPGTRHLHESEIRDIVGELLSAGFANVFRTREYVVRITPLA
jgi:nicotinamidase-related amidase